MWEAHNETKEVEGSKSSKPSHLRRLSFELPMIFEVSFLVPLLVGAVAAIQYIMFLVFNVWFNWHKHGLALLNLMADRGVPTDSLGGYYRLAMVDLPGWIVLGIIAFTLGCSRSSYQRTDAFVFALSTFLSSALCSITQPAFFFLAVVWMLCATPSIIVLTSWACGRAIRPRRAEPTYSGTSRTALAVRYAVLCALLPLSIYGWSILRQQ